MPDIIQYVAPTMQYVPRVDVQALGTTLHNMEQTHLKTIELEGEVQKALNQIDLDESENGYKAELANEITKTVDDSTVNGYAGYALSDLIRTAGNIEKNPVLITEVMETAKFTSMNGIVCVFSCLIQFACLLVVTHDQFDFPSGGISFVCSFTIEIYITFQYNCSEFLLLCLELFI